MIIIFPFGEVIKFVLMKWVLFFYFFLKLLKLLKIIVVGLRQ